MERLAPLLSKILIFCIIACNGREINLKKNVMDPNFSHQNGEMKYKNELFSGQTFELAGKDTIEIHSYGKGLEHGIWKKFYPTHQLAEIREFEKGKKVGEMKAWWPNKKLKMQYFFENDEYEGVCREWNQAGQLIIEMTYKNGHEEGSQKVFYDNGKIKANYVMKNGRRYGLLGTKNCVNASEKIF